MDSYILVIAGFATAFNIIIILFKFQHGKPASAAVDLAVFGTVLYFFSSSKDALAIGMIASMIFSLYLIINPIEGQEEMENE